MVVSPLIALQRDQVLALQAHDAGGAAQADSTVGVRHRREAFESMRSGDLEFLFLAPEQFNNPETLARLGEADPSLFVVDEAHCISAWGHDFRPEYLRLGAVAESWATRGYSRSRPPRHRSARGDHRAAGDARPEDPGCGVRPAEHPPVLAAVQRRRPEDRRPPRPRHQHPGLVYVATRRAAEELAEQLRLRDVKAAAYHGGLASKERDEAQRRFMDSEVDVVVATVAFGMGINKPDVRFVHHHAISESLDSYCTRSAGRP